MTPQDKYTCWAPIFTLIVFCNVCAITFHKTAALSLTLIYWGEKLRFDAKLSKYLLYIFVLNSTIKWIANDGWKYLYSARFSSMSDTVFLPWARPWQFSSRESRVTSSGSPVTSHVRKGALGKGESVYKTKPRGAKSKGWQAPSLNTTRVFFSFCNLQWGPDCSHDGLSYRPLVKWVMSMQMRWAIIENLQIICLH